MFARLAQFRYRFAAKMLAVWVLFNNREAQLAHHIVMWSKMAPTTFRYRLAESLQPWLAVQYNRTLCTYCGWAPEAIEIHPWCMQQEWKIVFFSVKMVEGTVVLTPSMNCEGTRGRPIVPGIGVYVVYKGHPYNCVGYAVDAGLTKDFALRVISCDQRTPYLKFADE